ncbi:MAG: hypothetical protein J6Y20_10305, partial [Lachnospiraceae bacterium]|nr:hypothetical protein [Lachnospiraceae bacterium]
MAGVVYYGTVENSYNAGDVVAGNESGYIGGVVGEASGVVGEVSEYCTVKNCYNSGDVVAGNNSFVIGGVVGSSSDADVTHCYFNSDTCDWGAIGEFGVGHDDERNHVVGLPQNSMIGEDALKSMVFSYEEGETSPWIARGNDAFYSYYPFLMGLMIGENDVQLDVKDIRRTDWAPRIKNVNTREISTYNELKEFASEVNGDGNNTPKPELCGILLNDIDCSGKTDWTPIGKNKSHPFKGIFDGQGYVIYNLNVNLPGTDYVGFFGCVEGVGDQNNILGGIVQSLCLDGGMIIGENYVGGVAGRNEGTVQSCYNTCAVYGKNCVGGIVGFNEGRVQMCYNIGAVTGVKNIGGVVGEEDGYGFNEILLCYNTGVVNGSVAGGVVGKNLSCTAFYCYNIGIVTGEYAGGVDAVGGAYGSCCYDKSICRGGEVQDPDAYIDTGATTYQMTGLNPLRAIDSENPADFALKDTFCRVEWMFLSDSKTGDKTYWHYPHLAGFACDYEDSSEADWPAKIEVSVTWNEPDSYMYDGTGKVPTVKDILVVSGDTIIPDDLKYAKVEYSVRSDLYIDYTIEEKWTTVEKYNVPGHYKMVFTDSADKVVYTKYFDVLETGDYTVTYDNSSEECKDAGEHTAVITFNKYGDENGYKTISKDFTILPREISIQTASNEWMYDGNAHSDRRFTIKEGSLAENDKLIIESESVTNVSDTKDGNNVVSGYKVLRGEEDVTNNYAVTVEAGTLTINPVGVRLTANNGTETYDGTEKSVSGFTCSVQGKTVQGLEFTDVSASGKGTVPGKYDVTFEGVTKNTTEDKT